MDILLQFSPNNECRLSLQAINAPRKKRGDSASQRESSKYAHLVQSSQVEVVRGFSMSAVLNTGCDRKNIIVTHDEADATEKVRLTSLDIICKLQQSEKTYKERRKKRVKSGYGLLGRVSRFTKSARRRIISAGAILEARCKNPASSVLVTCTLPGSSANAIAELPKWTGYLVNRCFSRVRAAWNVAESWRPAQLSWFYTWEIQKRGALHLHLCLWTNEPAFSEYLGTVFKEAWVNTIKDIDTKCQSDLCTKHDGKSCWLSQYWQNDVSVVRKSVARYISKYVSKDNTKSVVRNGARIHPSRWWGMDRLLTQEVVRNSPQIKARALSESRATGLFAILVKEIADMGVVQSYSWNADIGSGSYHAGWVHCSGFYLNADIFMSAKEWLLEFFTRCIADIDYSCIEYRNYDPLSSYSSEVANRLLEVAS